MDETQAELDRLERRIDEQAARIDALQRTLERHGLAPRLVRARDSRRRSTRLRLGTATGV